MLGLPRLLLFLCCSSLLTSCSLLNEDRKEIPFKNPVYANVFFEKTHKNGAPVHGIVAINYDNPKEFELLASGKSAYNNLRLSPDGKKLIYTDDYETGLGSNPQHGLYKIENGKRKLLFDEGEEDVPLFGNSSISVVWSKEGNGFYYTNPNQAFDNTLSTWYYDFDTNRTKILKEVRNKAIYPISIIEKDTLIIFSNEFNAIGLYLMDLNGDYIKKIDNAYLEHTNEDGVIKQGVIQYAWNDSLKLIAGAFISANNFSGYKIIVSDLEGTNFREFTNGDHLNSNPIWTKDGNIIFTEQRNLFNNQIQSELKKIDLTTGEITSFFSKREYPKITGIGTSDQ